MKFISREEAQKLRQRKGRRVSVLGQIIRDLPVGKSTVIDMDTHEIRNPYSAYGIARSVGKKVSVFKIGDSRFIIECKSAETYE